MNVTVLEDSDNIFNTLLAPRLISSDGMIIVRKNWAAIQHLKKHFPHMFRPLILDDDDIETVEMFEINTNYYLEIVDLEEYNEALDVLMDMYRL